MSQVWVRLYSLVQLYIVQTELVSFTVCGCRFEMVSSVTPARGQRLLAHIRKTSERVKRKKTAPDESSEDEEEERGKRGSWIRESSGGGDPVDFLDRSLAARISCESVVYCWF